MCTYYNEFDILYDVFPIARYSSGERDVDGEVSTDPPTSAPQVIVIRMVPQVIIIRMVPQVIVIRMVPQVIIIRMVPQVIIIRMVPIERYSSSKGVRRGT
jgi:hypothetical protein